MKQLLDLWASLELRRKVILITAALAVFGSVLAMARLAATPSMSLLYSGLENGQAGEVVRALEQKGVVYEVRGGAIYVEHSSRDELRMTLASEGLPANTTRGYELLDSLSGFGTTSQMFDAAYWRAKEGELARTIVGSRNILSARVHIAQTSSNPFLPTGQATASVTVTSMVGTVSGAQARAFRYLVASAVAGMSPDDVTVIDGTSGLVGAGEDPNASSTASDRSTELRESVTRLLEARVGRGNAVVELTIEPVTESESIVERVFDPKGRVAISTDTEERSTSSRGTGGSVTVASNLPDGEANAGADSSNEDSETRERVNYEVSETQREITREPGAIKRITVAVLVNATQTVGPEGTSETQPRAEDELAELRELVQSAIGFSSDRGDVVTLKSMPFEAINPAGTAFAPSFWSNLSLNLMSLLQLGVLAVVAIVLGLFVVKPLLLRPPTLPSAAQISRAGLAADPPTIPIDGEIDPETPLLNQDNTVTALPVDPSNTPDLTDPVDRLRALIIERQDETVDILRSWLEDRKEAT
ncbi:flagellar basal-body MS-ring/collar protein FliF [Shimia sediminis]|uniref:flagellar basal-body MS-ring/collar protein FliF n=1 Tax=Shimia sediminis TaxID=2497945 RepID=UPI000F8F6A7B|nr:flagellar basal-body MS-ring/collar protein FliF [Shimia sediminis]